MAFWKRSNACLTSSDFQDLDLEVLELEVLKLEVLGLEILGLEPMGFGAFLVVRPAVAADFAACLCGDFAGRTFGFFAAEIVFLAMTRYNEEP